MGRTVKQKKKILPDKIVPAAKQRRRDNLLASMPGICIMSTSVSRHFDVVCLLGQTKQFVIPQRLKEKRE